jgi:hypothetical protein
MRFSGAPESRRQIACLYFLADTTALQSGAVRGYLNDNKKGAAQQPAFRNWVMRMVV